MDHDILSASHGVNDVSFRCANVEVSHAVGCLPESISQSSPVVA